MPTGGRKTHYQAMHQISGQGGFGQLSGVLGVLPVGAVMSVYRFLTSQAFNSTTNTLSLGITPGGTEILAALDVKALQIGGGVIPTPAAAAALNASGPTPVYYTLGSTGAAPTAGVITAWIEYLPGCG